MALASRYSSWDSAHSVTKKRPCALCLARREPRRDRFDPGDDGGAGALDGFLGGRGWGGRDGHRHHVEREHRLVAGARVGLIKIRGLIDLGHGGRFP